ncbi:hypothetical protein ABGB07_45635 [Micromonosporaceae bacterium B7E4]
MISRRTFAKGLVAGAAAVTAPHALTGARSRGILGAAPSFRNRMG